MPLNDEDTITADGTEQTVWDVTTGTKFLMGQIDLQEMQTGDTLVIRRYIKVRTSSTLAVEWEDTYADAQTDMNIINFPPLSPVSEYKVTLEQTGGTNRDYDFKLWEA